MATPSFSQSAYISPENTEMAVPPMGGMKWKNIGPFSWANHSQLIILASPGTGWFSLVSAVMKTELLEAGRQDYVDETLIQGAE